MMADSHPTIRPARRDDVGVLHELIRALAVYEKLEHAMVASEAWPCAKTPLM